MKQNPYQNHKSANAPKILGLIILLVFVFALGWNVGAGQIRQTTGTFPIEKQSSQVSSSDKVDMQLFWDVWSLLASKYVDPTVLDYKKHDLRVHQGNGVFARGSLHVIPDPKGKQRFPGKHEWNPRRNRG